jgi:hypothetical protein
MVRGKMFTCQKCDFDMEVEDPEVVDTLVCHRCGQGYTLQWLEQENVWELIPIEPVEENERRAGGPLAEDEPFRILNEPGGLRTEEDDFEQS